MYEHCVDQSMYGLHSRLTCEDSIDGQLIVVFEVLEWWKVFRFVQTSFDALHLKGEKQKKRFGAQFCRQLRHNN